ncbi:MAG TPA: 2,3-bisphosphoglycerate-independent phosphoglycerate mutase [Phycisphaerales bacterium]|nr:2,3-bisphosphoglycerate-independent phosphoglycerate mutase [Phycisphaerales bacterium]
MPTGTPLVLIIRDGWGLNPNPDHAAFDAVRVAQSRGLTPVADRLMREYPWTLVKTSGADVGLPEGTMGNSEVGHQNIGAGRVVEQESKTITDAVSRGFETISQVARSVVRARDAGGCVHLMGINSDAGVHGLLEHLYAFVRACKALGVPPERVFVHLFTDGRDSPPMAGLEYARRVEEQLAAIGVGRVASVHGRYYAMDRDHRWERVKLAYDVLTGRSEAPAFPTAAAAIRDYYDRPFSDSQVGDEFIPPRRVGAPAPIADGDTVIFYNFRGDRPREISAAFVFPDDKWADVKPSPDSGVRGFDRGRKLDTDYVILTEYWEELLPFVSVAFPRPPKMKHIGGEHLSALGLRQFRCAETEKYPHVTFFFNDYRDGPFPGEVRENPQSPRVATYDLKPEMAAPEVRDAVLRRLASPACEDVLIVNFANGDMVGHTGKLDAAVAAVATVDACVGAIVDAALARGGQLIVTADHGNCEQMWDPAHNAPHTAHTIYDVPLIVVSSALRGRRLRGDTDAAGWFEPATRASRGRLADIFPTALAMLGLPEAEEMTGKSLLA